MRRDEEQILRKVLRTYVPGKIEESTTENKMGRNVPVGHEKYWTENMWGDGQDDMK